MSVQLKRKMKISQAKQLSIALNTMMEEKGTIALKLMRNKRMIDEELKEYYALEESLFRKYGEEKDGQLVIAKDSENYPLFLKEIEPLNNEEVSFEFRKITEEDLAYSNLTANQMAVIWEWMVEHD